MMEFSIELATTDDDVAIRRLLATNPIPGRVVVTYEREPSYLLGCGTMGRFCQVAVARHQPSGEVAGVACRATQPLFVNGQVEEVGYLGRLRVDKRFRRRGVLSLGLYTVCWEEGGNFHERLDNRISYVEIAAL